MAFRDELEALRVQNETLDADLKQTRAALGQRQERLAKLEQELELEKARVGELEDLLGGERGQAARRRQAIRRVALVAALALLGAGAYQGYARLQRAELAHAEAMRQSERSLAERSHCQARSHELEMENAMLENQLRALANRLGGGRRR